MAAGMVQMALGIFGFTMVYHITDFNGHGHDRNHF